MRMNQVGLQGKVNRFGASAATGAAHSECMHLAHTKGSCGPVIRGTEQQAQVSRRGGRARRGRKSKGIKDAMQASALGGGEGPQAWCVPGWFCGFVRLGSPAQRRKCGGFVSRVLHYNTRAGPCCPNVLGARGKPPAGMARGCSGCRRRHGRWGGRLSGRHGGGAGSGQAGSIANSGQAGGIATRLAAILHHLVVLSVAQQARCAGTRGHTLRGSGVGWAHGGGKAPSQHCTQRLRSEHALPYSVQHAWPQYRRTAPPAHPPGA